MIIQSTVHLDFDEPTKKYRVVDSTDYLGLYGLDVTTVGGTGALILGTVFFNQIINIQRNTVQNPLINHAVSNVSAWFDLPVDSNNEIVNGSWTGTVSLHIEVSNGQLTSVISPVVTTDGDNWLYYFLNIGDTITLNFGPSGTENITVLAFTDEDPNVQITANASIAAESYDSWAIDLTHASGTLTHSYKECVKKVACIETMYDCDSTVTGTFTGTDATDYGTQTIVATELKLIPPAWAKETYNAQNSVFTGTSPLTGTATQLYEGSWTVMLASEVTYTQSDGLVVNYDLTATVDRDVSCQSSLCRFTKCINKLRAAVYSDMKLTGQSVYEKFLLNVLTYTNQALIYKSCSDMEGYRASLVKIEAELDASGLGCDCGCGDEGFRRILNVPPDVYNIITQLEAQYAGIPTVLFDSALIFATEIGNNDYPNIQTYYRPFSDIEDVVINKSYFDANPNGYAQKFVEIELITYTRSAAPIFNIQNAQDNSVLYDGGNYLGDKVTTRHLIKITTFKNAGTVYQIVAGESFQVNNDSPSTGAIDSFYNSNVGVSLWDIDDNLHLKFAPLINPDKMLITGLKIIAYTTA